MLIGAAAVTHASLLPVVEQRGEAVEIAFSPPSFSASSHPLPLQPIANFVLMLADDMGYGDLGVNNLNIASETPHLDDLAATGMNFFDMHSGASVCTPARATLLTGRLRSAWAWCRTSVKPLCSG